MFSVGQYGLLSWLAVAVTCTASSRRSNGWCTIPSQVETLDVDVCIIGGGSAGTYTAVRLQEMGKSVTLVEKAPQLGGSVNTYFDPISQTYVDYGVKVFDNVSIVRNYFDSLGVALQDFKSFAPNQKTIYANLEDGEELPASSISGGNVTDGLLRYRDQLQKYPYLDLGFQLPSPVPEDLLMPWGQFLQKYNLSAMSEVAFGLVGGPGNILAQPTLYVAKNFGVTQVNSALEGSEVTEAQNNNQALYDAALTRLNNATPVFVGSNVTCIYRGANDTEISVSTPSGPKLIRASKLVIAIPPTLSLLTPLLDLSIRERELFSQFNHSYIWASIVDNTGVPVDTGLTNINPAAPFGIPAMPAIFGTEPTGLSGSLIVWYGSPFALTAEEVQANIIETLSRYNQTNGGASTQNATTPRILEFRSHNPYMLTVTPEAIAGGFYDEVNQLQGHRNTYWTGAAWQTQDSTAIWNFTELEILPRIMAELD